MAIRFRDTTHDCTRRDRLREAERVLVNSFPQYVHGCDNELFYKFGKALNRIHLHISDWGWGVRLSH